ncbi:MAG: beta-ketoacyl synthase [Deltaproteobacteria bacterium SG8_13]|nr:MAG: beta-ketoacyl synthase [Deltaproteobacteria bacterium SG8_13]
MSRSQPVWLTEAVTVTALGDSLQQLWDRLMAGRSGIREVEHFPVDQYASRWAAAVPGLTPSGGRTGRSRLHPLLERLFDSMPAADADTVLFTATTKAGIDSLEPLCRGQAADTTGMVPSDVPRLISRRLGLTAEGVNINAACASSTIAVAKAASLIRTGRASSVLVCCMDVITDFVFSGFSALQALSRQPCRPFDRDRSGLTLGEGAAALQFMSAERAAGRNRKPLAAVVGWGMSNDATHITAPARDGCGLIRAIEKALHLSQLDPGQIGAVSAHGTGTVYNDAMELTAIRHVFGDRSLPVYSVKGAIGHTLGAAGGIEVALAAKALAEGMVPPTVGLLHPEPEAESLVSTRAQNLSGSTLLTTNSGFGGINAAIVLKSGSLP